MNEYLCQVARQDGTKLTFKRTAASEAVLLRDLSNEGYLILHLGPAVSGEGTKTRLGPKEVLQFTEILETLTGNGLTLKAALALARPLGGKELSAFLSGIDAKVQKGHSLYDALREGPRGFSPLYLGLIRIGERTGDLALIFPRLVEYLKAREALREKTINALVYPLFVLGVALVGVALLSLFVLPALTSSISGVNPEVARQYTNNVSGFQTGTAFFFGVLVAAVLAVAGLRYASIRSPSVALWFDQVLLSTPLVGSLLWKSFCLHISFSLEILLTSGFSLEAALHESGTLIANQALQASWSRVRERVVKGATLSRSLREEAGYPEVFVGWVEVGESAHDLKSAFHHLRTFYQNQIDLLSSRFANLAEPTLIVVVGALVVFLVMTFVTPIFTMLGRII